MTIRGASHCSKGCAASRATAQFRRASAAKSIRSGFDGESIRVAGQLNQQVSEATTIPMAEYRQADLLLSLRCSVQRGRDCHRLRQLCCRAHHRTVPATHPGPGLGTYRGPARHRILCRRSRRSDEAENHQRECARSHRRDAAGRTDGTICCGYGLVRCRSRTRRIRISHHADRDLDRSAARSDGGRWSCQRPAHSAETNRKHIHMVESVRPHDDQR